MQKKANHFPNFIEPQFPLEVEMPPIEKIWLHEIKFDGLRLQVHIQNKKIKLYNTHGEDLASEFPTLRMALLELPVKNAILEGEAVILDRQGKTQFSHLEKALRYKDDTQIKIFLFDLLYFNDKDLRKSPLKERKAQLEELIPIIHPRVRFSHHVYSDPENFFDINCKQQLEGIISKVANSSYESGLSHNWTKTRCSKTQEFFIAGIDEDTEEFILGFYERNKLWFAGKVRPNGEFVRIKKQLLKHKTDNHSFEKFEKLTRKHNISWVEPIIKAEINFSNWTDEKRLRNPVFLELVT